MQQHTGSPLLCGGPHRIYLGSGLAWALLLVVLFVQLFNAPVLLARILAGIFTSVWNFYLNARFNFRSRAFIPRK